MYAENQVTYQYKLSYHGPHGSTNAKKYRLNWILGPGRRQEGRGRPRVHPQGPQGAMQPHLRHLLHGQREQLRGHQEEGRQAGQAGS